ncbi:MAG: TonB-dependent receptor plug domain-containing protein, partial [Candidatus Heimdallarchaeota archaeon]|nr:TonB-dependent receptor plug domain-containing protein [Candidatus Heimdallarchaeota archaeon]
MAQKWIIKLIMLFALIAGTQSIYSQQLSVTGTITDESGELLIGVNITIKGTTVGTISNVEGKYEIQVSSDAEVLVFSFIGMITQEIPIGDQTVIDLTMETDILGLEEIVVIGYGTVRKTDFTGSVAIVKGEELADVTINSIQHALPGRAAGVQVSQGSSMPGGGISIRIRGSNSINSSNEPLYVVDGFPIMQNSGAIPSGNKGNTVTENPLASLNPSDIESIEILKDASATAIYGSRGANG